LKELKDMTVDNKLILSELSRNRIIINDKIIIEILVTIITALVIKRDFLIFLFLYYYYYSYLRVSRIRILFEDFIN
jgi:hypothetical protein